MKIGDKVKIKPYEEIYNNKNADNSYGGFYCDELLFDPTMKTYCGQIGTLSHRKEKSYGTIWKVEENGWWWHSKWLIADFFSDEDFDI